MGKKKDTRTSMETWYQQTVSRLYRFTYALLQNREEAEDITQETYFRCLRKNAETLPPYPYLKRTARNLINDRYRHWKITQDHTEDQLTSENPATEEDWINQTLVQETLNRLPAHYRQVLQLRIVEGYSRKETAERMERSEDTIRGLQYRALQSLRDLLQPTVEMED